MNHQIIAFAILFSMVVLIPSAQSGNITIANIHYETVTTQITHGFSMIAMSLRGGRLTVMFLGGMLANNRCHFTDEDLQPKCNWKTVSRRNRLNSINKNKGRDYPILRQPEELNNFDVGRVGSDITCWAERQLCHLSIHSLRCVDVSNNTDDMKVGLVLNCSEKCSNALFIIKNTKALSVYLFA